MVIWIDWAVLRSLLSLFFFFFYILLHRRFEPLDIDMLRIKAGNIIWNSGNKSECLLTELFQRSHTSAFSMSPDRTPLHSHLLCWISLRKRRDLRAYPWITEALKREVEERMYSKHSTIDLFYRCPCALGGVRWFGQENIFCLMPNTKLGLGVGEWAISSGWTEYDILDLIDKLSQPKGNHHNLNPI